MIAGVREAKRCLMFFFGHPFVQKVRLCERQCVDKRSKMSTVRLLQISVRSAGSWTQAQQEFGALEFQTQTDRIRYIGIADVPGWINQNHFGQEVSGFLSIEQGPDTPRIYVGVGFSLAQFSPVYLIETETMLWMASDTGLRIQPAESFLSRELNDI